MPSATNQIMVVEARLWAIVGAWSGFSIVKSNNRIRFDVTADPFTDNVKPNRMPADSVEVKLDVPGNGTADPRAPRTFCLQPDITTYEFVWTMTAADRLLNNVTQVHAEIKAAMVAAGVQLGIPTVVCRWDGQLRPGRASPKERQLIYTMRITVKG